MNFTRQLRLEGLKLSAFVFGPRMTGKTFLLRRLECALFIDLLDPEMELNYRHSPRHFWERISALPEKSLVIVDEVQKVPALLDYVQKGIEERSFALFFPVRAPANLNGEGLIFWEAGRWICICIP